MNVKIDPGTPHGNSGHKSSRRIAVWMRDVHIAPSGELNTLSYPGTVLDDTYFVRCEYRTGHVDLEKKEPATAQRHPRGILVCMN